MSGQPAIGDLVLIDPRFAAKVDVCESGCWVWRGARNANGYGNVHRDGRTWRAHRLAYTLLIGNVPGGLHLDHLCRVRLCVNPAHMEPVTNRTNIMRGTSPTARHAVKQFCDAGHAFDDANTYHWRGGRFCRACRAEAKRRQRARSAA